MCSAISTFATNSAVRSMLRQASFSSGVSRRWAPMVTAIEGGSR
jgi:hypothetical protein